MDDLQRIEREKDYARSYFRKKGQETEPCIECERLVYWDESIQDYVHADKPEIGCGLYASE